MSWLMSMHDNDFNPYAPPVQDNSPAVSTDPFEGRDYRIEKNVIILRSPFHLPPACFLTGARRELLKCEIPLKVMPRWWSYLMPVMIVSMQMIVVVGNRAIQKMQLPTPPWLGPPLAGVVAGFTVPALVFGGLLFVAKKITLTGFRESSDAVYLRRRRFIARVLLLDLILGGLLLLLWMTLETNTPLVIITLISIFFIFVLTLSTWMRNRKPWSRLGALLQADGSLAVYGLDPSFLAVCRLGLDDSTAPPTPRTFA